MGGSGKSGNGGKGGNTGKGGKGGAAPSTNFDWSVKIVPVSPGVAGFKPDVLGAKVGDSLQAQLSDIVTWGNTTKDTHQPVRTDTGQPLCNKIAGGDSSAPQYVVVDPVGTVIKYKCAVHPQELGSITVVPPFS